VDLCRLPRNSITMSTFTPFRKRTFSKYHAVKQTYNGYSYDSKAEAQYAAELDLRVKGKDIKSWDRQKKIELFGQNGTRICNYFVDFVIEHIDGRTEYVEVKGFETEAWRIKRKLMDDKIKGMESAFYTVVKV